MTWKPPQTETEWQEILSAYLDEQLAPDEKQALERLLATDPRRAEQLQDLRGLSHLLREWSVVAPEPNPVHLQQLHSALKGRDERRDGGQSWWTLLKGWRLRWEFQAALFFAGLLTGLLWPHLSERSGAPTPLNGEHPTVAMVSRSEGVEVALSPTQAEQLTREVKAANLKDTVIRGLNEQNWNMAQQAFETLRQQYPDSQALRELQTDASLRRLQDQLLTVERI